MGKEYLVDPALLKKTVASIFVGFGTPENEALIVADSLVEAELTGLKSHGVQRVKFYVDSIKKGGTSAASNITIEKDFGGTALLDAHGALGIVAAYKAMEMAIKKAKQYGIGIVNVCHSNHCSCTAYFAKMATSRDMISIVASNSVRAMAPWGGKETFLGTNPLAIAVPTHAEPVIVDMATSVAARGKIILANKKGEPIPEGWAIDKDGLPTTDAAKALEGSVLPFGGPKGSGIAMMIDIICGLLSGSGYGKTVNSPFTQMEVPMNTGHSLVAIDVSRFMDPEEFKTKMDAYVREVKDLEKASGVEEIFLPGEIESRNHAKNLAKGIVLSDVIYEELKALCKEVSCDFDILLEKECA